MFLYSGIGVFFTGSEVSGQQFGFMVDAYPVMGIDHLYLLTQVSIGYAVVMRIFTQAYMGVLLNGIQPVFPDEERFLW